MRRLLPCIILFISLLHGAPLFAQEQNAMGVVEQFQSSLLAVMKDASELGYQGRYDRLAPAVEASHDLAGIAKFAAGRYWDKLTAAQQKKLVDTFSRQSISTYAYRFAAYTGQSFKTLSEEQTARGDALVRTVFTDPADTAVRFDYVLHRTGEGWRIANIIVDGVSDLAIKRADYSSILRTQGIDVLLAKLQGQIDRYAKSGQ